jgi:FkbM family methyltransferase
MKESYGIWLPDGDAHFPLMLARGKERHGKRTYQLSKYLEALKHVKRKKLAVDVGGHVGLWSYQMSHDFEDVIAYEPVEEHRLCYYENMQGRTNYTLHGVAVSHKPDVLYMETPGDNTGHTQVALMDKGEAVSAITLDDQEYPDTIDFLKIDVEGFELHVVQGAEQVIRSHKPVIIVEQKANGNAERFGLHQLAAVTLLKKWGMREVALMSGDHIMVWP